MVDGALVELGAFVAEGALVPLNLILPFLPLTGDDDGPELGIVDGEFEGLVDGSTEGTWLGLVDGSNEGTWLGLALVLG